MFIRIIICTFTEINKQTMKVLTYILVRMEIQEDKTRKRNILRIYDDEEYAKSIAVKLARCNSNFKHIYMIEKPTYFKLVKTRL